MALSDAYHMQQCLSAPLQSSSSAAFRTSTSCSPRVLPRATSQTNDTTVLRRSGNFQPNIWDFNFIQSLTSEYTGDVHLKEAKLLKAKVRDLFNAVEVGSLAILELIDASQKLGIAYLFEKEIGRILNTIATKSNYCGGTEDSLHATALRFRLLRQHGHQLSEDIFIRYMDGNGKFRDSLSDDITGLMSLYEASHLAVEGESILDEAKAFAKRQLENTKQQISPALATHISHSLELPLHWRMLRQNARWYIGGMTPDSTSSDLLQLAKLDFNIVQAIHQTDLKETSKWWMDLGLLNPHLSFARDRLMESFLGTVGINFKPQFSYCRKGLTKVFSLITTIDDVYDIYGTIEELELFTDAVERWDIAAMERLPYYMKICFLALYNTVNEIAYNSLKEEGISIIHYLKKSWADLCKTYLTEAKWYYNKHTPTLEEYLNNAWISISGPVILVHAYFLLEQGITREALQQLEDYPDIVRWSSMIFRLADDLGTASGEIERGDVPKSIQCHMHETGCCEESAREHIRDLISEHWKKMNKDRIDDSLFPQPFVETAVNLARTAQFMYQYGDGYGIPDQETKDQVISLLLEPVTLPESATFHN